MIWLALLSGLAALVLVFFNVQPVWVQYVVFGVSLSFFITYLMRDIGNGKPKAGPSVSWMRKRHSVLTIFFLFLAVGNFLARRYEVVWDVSRYKTYALRDQTISWLKKIGKPVEVMIFLSNDDKTVGYAEWFQKQANQQTSNIKIALKNINREVLLTQKYGVKHEGETVLVSEDNWVKTDTFGESSLVTGLMRLLSKNNASLCFLIGHGEPDISHTFELGPATEFLNNLGYTTKAVSLDSMAALEIEKDCSVLMVIGSRTEFLPLEAQRLAALMKNLKLPLLFALDLPASQAIQKELQNEGIDLSSDLVVNTGNAKEGIPFTDIVLYAGAISALEIQDVTGKIYLPEVQALSLKSDSQTSFLDWHPFITTPPSGKFHLAEGVEQSEPLTLAAYGLDRYGKIKRILLGSGRLFLPRPFNFGDNRKLIMSSLTWLLGEKEMSWVDSPLKDEPYMQFSVPEEFWLKNTVIYILPGMAFLLLFFFWFKRRIGS